MQSFYFAEIQRGMIDVGDFKPHKCFQSLLQDPDDVKIPECYDPQEIVDIVKGSILKNSEETDHCTFTSDMKESVTK